MKEDRLHKDFRLQGRSFSSLSELINFSEEISMDVAHFLRQWFDHSKALKVRTSGSTGLPKEMMLRKYFMTNSAMATGKYFDLPAKTSALLCMSPNFIAGKMMLVRALTLGWHLDVVSPVANPLKIYKKTYDFCAMVPLQVAASLCELHLIKKLIIGGGTVSEELQKVIQGADNEVFATYGMTETITHIAVKKLNVSKLNKTDEYQKLSEYYQVLPGITITSDDRDCLVIDAPEISDKKVITNDLVKIISTHQFKWLGRFDTIINSGGIKLIPEQIEEKLSTLINARFFMAGIPDADLGEKMVLIIEGAEKKSLKFDHLINEIKKINSLSKYEIPKAVYHLEKFIETESKKVNRTKTLQLLESEKL